MCVFERYILPHFTRYLQVLILCLIVGLQSQEKANIYILHGGLNIDMVLLLESTVSLARPSYISRTNSVWDNKLQLRSCFIIFIKASYAKYEHVIPFCMPWARHAIRQPRHCCELVDTAANLWQMGHAAWTCKAQAACLFCRSDKFVVRTAIFLHLRHWMFRLNPKIRLAESHVSAGTKSGIAHQLAH